MRFRVQLPVPAPLLAGLALLAPLAGPDGVVAQERPRGEAGRPEVQGWDWKPDGAWRRKAAAVRARRAALRSAGDFAALNAPLERAFLLRAPGEAGLHSSDALTGTVHVPSILIAYSDVAVAYPVADFQTVLFSETPGAIGPNRAYSLKTYYEEISNGLITMTGRVFQPVRMDTTAAYYQDNCNGIGVVTACPNGGQRFGRMLLAILDSISHRPGGDTTWNSFDNDGPDGLPNSGDDDGYVDFVTFLQPTKDGACQPSAGIWSHRYVIRAWNGGSPYATRTPRRNSSGQPIPGQFLLVDEYTIQSQLGGVSGCDDSEIMPIGTASHETGHAFGLPDLYDTENSTQGIGEWGLMGAGGYARPYSPASHEPWSLAELGWVTLADLAATQVVTTGPRQLTDTVFVARTPDPKQYFLLENRQAVHSDTAQMNPAYSKQKLPGLLVWLVDEDRIASGRAANRVNTGARQGVSLYQADGLNQLRTPGSKNRGDKGDSYPGTSLNTRLTLTSNPAARDNLNRYAGFILDSIAPLAGTTLRFRILRRGPSAFYTIMPGGGGAQIRVNGVTASVIEDVFEPGAPVELAVDTLQLLAGGRTMARFLSWSDGGAPTHTLISGATPDTVSATFAARHRLQALAVGGGGVAATPPGDITGGVFLDQGAQVSLTATAPAGIVFVRWEGDTTGTSPTLALTMKRPYDVQAVFTTELVVSVPAATSEVLGTPSLTPEQKTYLDLFGNRNGTFDLGDYLALLHREGVVPPPAVRALVEALRRKP